MICFAILRYILWVQRQISALIFHHCVHCNFLSFYCVRVIQNCAVCQVDPMLPDILCLTKLCLRPLGHFSPSLQYIPRNMHTVFALLYFVVVIHWLIFPYPSGLLHWHCGNLTIAPVPAKQPWWIWINTSCEFIMNDCITTTKQSTTKPCAYFLGYTVGLCIWLSHCTDSTWVELYYPCWATRGVTIHRCIGESYRNYQRYANRIVSGWIDSHDISSGGRNQAIKCP